MDELREQVERALAETRGDRPAPETEKVIEGNALVELAKERIRLETARLELIGAGKVRDHAIGLAERYREDVRRIAGERDEARAVAFQMGNMLELLLRAYEAGDLQYDGHMLTLADWLEVRALVGGDWNKYRPEWQAVKARKEAAE